MNNAREYQVIKTSNLWSTERLRKEAEDIVKRKASEGWDVVSVSFGHNVWWVPTVFITIRK